MASPDATDPDATPVRPDAVTDTHFVWIKRCSTLRLTNQLRSAVAAARANERRVLLVAPQACRFHPDLETFIATCDTVDVRRMG